MNNSTKDHLNKSRSRFQYSMAANYGKRPYDEPEMQKARVFVGSLDSSVRKIDLEKKFSKHGKILGISMNKNFAFVQFASEASADEAIKAENGVFFHGQRIGMHKSVVVFQVFHCITEVNFARASERMREKCHYEYRKRYTDDYLPDNNQDDFHPPEPKKRTTFDSFKKETSRSLGGNSSCRGYAEEVEQCLKHMGIQVDLLFPKENAHLPTLLTDITARGALYAIVITAQNELHRSVTVNLLQGIPQEHRNMPLEDAMTLIARNYEVYMKSIQDCSFMAKSQGFSQQKHPENICMLLTFLLDNRPLTLAEYDCLINYLKEKRDRVLKDLENSTRSQISSTTLNYPENSHILQQNEPQNFFGMINPNPSMGVVSSSSAVGDCLSTYSSSLRMSSTTNLAPGLGATSSASNINYSNPTMQRALENFMQSGLHNANCRTASESESISRMNHPAMSNYHPFIPYNQFGMPNVLGSPPMFNATFDPTNKQQRF